MTSNNFKNNLKYNYTNPDQQSMVDKFICILDEYEKNNSYENREFLCYLTSAIYLTYKKLYPQFSIYIPFRTKSDMSCIQNIQKEFNQEKMKNIDSEKPFDDFPIIKDMSGIRIILNDINFSLPSTPESEELFNNPEIKELMGDNDNINSTRNLNNKKKYNRRENFELIHKIDYYIHSPIKNGKEYFELKKELLSRIIAIAPKEFTDERNPDPSFVELYKDIQRKYDYFLETDNFPTNISASQITDLTDLLNDFRSRVDDPLHFAILEKTLPIVFNQPIIKNALQTSYKFEKESKKPNGFQARYDTLFTPFGPIEVQSQSNRAYYTSTKGSSYHSGMAGKSIDIKEFFELVDPNDSNDLSYYLNALDSTSADKMVSPYEIPEFKTEDEKQSFFKTSDGIAFLESERYREMMKHIKFKKEILIGKTSVDANSYLLSTALSLSPYMNVCSSGHTSSTTAAIHHKKVIGEFAEVLRKKDSNTCLRDLIIRRLEQLIEYPPENSNSEAIASINKSLQIIKNHDETARKLPKDISKKNIISYAEKLRNMKKFYPDIEID